MAAWPPLTPGLHRLSFEQGRVQLLLAIGDVAAVLPKLRLSVDAFFLGHTTPAGTPGSLEALTADPRDTHLVKACGALAAAGATLLSLRTDHGLRAQLITAGFVPRATSITAVRPALTVADWAPRHSPRRLPTAATPGRRAVVVGAGLAGAAAAQALAQAGWQVTVLERHAAPAQEASGNPAGLFHGTVNADDGLYARLFRAAALHAQAVYRAAIDARGAGRG